MLFLAQFVPSRVTLARIFCMRVPCKALTNKMASKITSLGDEQIPFLSSLPPLNLRQDLDNYSKCEDCERDSAYVKHRSESVFDKSSDGEMSEMSILSRRHQ